MADLANDLLHNMAKAQTSFDARLRKAMSEGYADNDQLKVKGELVPIPHPEVADRQENY